MKPDPPPDWLLLAVWAMASVAVAIAAALYIWEA